MRSTPTPPISKTTSWRSSPVTIDPDQLPLFPEAGKDEG